MIGCWCYVFLRNRKEALVFIVRFLGGVHFVMVLFVNAPSVIVLFVAVLSVRAIFCKAFIGLF